MKALKTYYVYILSNKSRCVYVGTTSELEARLFKHKNKWYEGSFTARYNFDMLVYFERYSTQEAPLSVKKKSKAGGGRKG